MDKTDIRIAKMLLSLQRQRIYVMCIPTAMQRHGKQASTIERVFSMGSTPQTLLCNGSVNMFQQ
jgi:hypothetical protein